jgi:hypothetical protein
MIYGKIVRILMDEKKTKIMVQKDRKKQAVEMKNDEYEALVEKNQGTFMDKEVEITRNKNGFIIKVFA